MRISRALQLRVALLFSLAVFVTRLPTFFRSVMDWDESLYFLMAEQWRAGHLPYTTLWDNKPIGIYGLFALFQYGLGDQVVAIRIASAMFVALAAFVVFNIVLALPLAEGRWRLAAAGLAGTTYVIGSLTNDGLAANTEIFMACFGSLAMLNALRDRPFLAGSMFGLAFMIKYVVVFEAPALLFALLALAPGRGPRRGGLSAGRLLTGAALPLLLTLALYAVSGHARQWLEASVLSNIRRVSVPISAQAVHSIFAAEMIRWSPLFAASLAMLLMALARLPALLRSEPLTAPARINLFLALWLMGGGVGVASAKSFFDHYFLQLLPVLCVTLAWLLLLASPSRYLTPLRGAMLAGAALALPLLAAGTAISEAAQPILSFSNGRLALRQDTPSRIAGEIRRHLPSPPGASGRIYVFDYQPIIYSLTHQPPPTKYAFPSVLTKCQLAHVAGVRPLAEIDRILAGRPEFIIRSLHPLKDPQIVNLRAYAALNRALLARYQLWRVYDDAVVYRLRDPDAAIPPAAADLPPCPGQPL